MGVASENEDMMITKIIDSFYTALFSALKKLICFAKKKKNEEKKEAFS